MIDNLTHSPISTKLQRPRVGHGLVPRPRLLEQLNIPHSLTFILAPAGYGKTTLLNIWLDTCPVPNAWLSLDEHDNDLTVFVNGLTEALQGVLPGVFHNTFTMLHGITLPFPEALAHSLLDDLAAIEQDFILVLDDYHVIHNTAIHDLLLELVSYPPRSLHLVLASRLDPPIPIARLRGLGHVVELRAADLRFTPEEVGRFLGETMALPADEQTIALLVNKTEGWPVGLRLLALSLRRQHTPGMSAADVFAGNSYVMDYLLTEVLSSLPITVQDFLIKTSFLDWLFGPLCAAVTGMVDRMVNGQPILEWLQRADLFLTPADDRQRYYRWHDLFRQFLRDRLEQQCSPAEITALRLRASAWLAANGDLDEALHQALASGDRAAAVQVVMEHRHELMNQSQWQRLERWVNLFPRDVINEYPDLLLSEVSLKFVRHQVGDVPALLDRVEALLAPSSADRDEALRAELETRRCAVNYYLGDWTRNLSAHQRTLEKLPTGWWFLRGYARLFLSVSYQLAGDLTQAYAVLYTGGNLDRSLDYHRLLLACACFTHWIAADLSGMAQAGRQALAMSDPTDVAESVTWSRYHLGLYHYQLNDFQAAEEQLLPLVMRPYASDASCFLNSAVLLARIRQVQNRPQEAREIAEVALSFALEIRSEVTLRSARAFQAELALRQGRLAEAYRWAETSGAFVRLPAPHAYVPALTWAMILLAQDTAASRDQARQLLTQLDDYFTSIHYTAIRIRVLALQAMLSHAEGAEPQALTLLENSIALAEPGGFLRLFVELGPQLKPLLTTLAQRGVSPAYLAAILAAYAEADNQPLAAAPLEPLASDSTRSAAAGPIEPLTYRERDVLLLLAKRYSNKEIAATLSISVGTVRTHIQHTGDKLGVRGRRAIVQAAKDLGLLA